MICKEVAGESWREVSEAIEPSVDPSSTTISSVGGFGLVDASRSSMVLVRAEPTLWAGRTTLQLEEDMDSKFRVRDARLILEPSRSGSSVLET
jgi:hypothetical protein